MPNPSRTGRGIDHLVLAVHGLDHARKIYQAMGFTMTPVARHPFGTHNSLIQLDNCFLEVLGMRDPRAIPAVAPGQFSFARFNHYFLEWREGMSMLVLESQDAEADAHAFAHANLQAYLPFSFEREATQPDGSVKKVGFVTAFASDPFMPECGFFTCQNRFPENFWKPDYQRHANCAKTISSVHMVATDPADHHRFLQFFCGVRDVNSSTLGIDIVTPRGTVHVLTPNAAKQLWGTAVDLRTINSPRFIGYGIEVTDLSETRKALDEGGVPFGDQGTRLVVSSVDAFGAAIAFHEAEQGIGV
ncbi:MAG: VOC family protein [Pseudomonadota bacterium]